MSKNEQPISQAITREDRIETRIETLENLVLNRQAPDKLQIDADIQDLLYTHLCSKIASTDEQAITKIKESIKELVKVLSGELLLHLITTVNGLPIEVSMHNLSMQSDIPA